MEQQKLPKIGLGTWMLKEYTCTNSVINGLDIGYRFIDTAQVYGNEREVGNGISASPVPRKDFILATKLRISRFRWRSPWIEETNCSVALITPRT